MGFLIGDTALHIVGFQRGDTAFNIAGFQRGDTALHIVGFLSGDTALHIVGFQRGDTALHIAIRARSKRITELLLRNPGNSRLLYRPNKFGDTPYSMDMYHQRGILQGIHGQRKSFFIKRLTSFDAFYLDSSVIF